MTAINYYLVIAKNKPIKSNNMTTTEKNFNDYKIVFSFLNPNDTLKNWINETSYTNHYNDDWSSLMELVQHCNEIQIFGSNKHTNDYELKSLNTSLITFDKEKIYQSAIKFIGYYNVLMTAASLSEIYESECLFVNYEKQPEDLKLICDKYEGIFTKKGLSYKNCAKWLKKVQKLGYTFDYGLDGEPYNLMTNKRYNDLLKIEISAYPGNGVNEIF